MPVPLAMGLISGAAQLGKMIGGAVQTSRANKILEGLERPTMEVPGSVTEGTGVAREAVARSKMLAANPLLPGQTRAEENIKQSTANALSAAKEYGGVASAGSLVAGEQGAMKDLGVSAATKNLQNKQLLNQQMGKLTAQLNREGAYEQEAFNFNEAKPYYEAVESSAALRETGGQNMMSALDNAAAIGITAMGRGGANPTLRTGADGQPVAEVADVVEQSIPASNPMYDSAMNLVDLGLPSNLINLILGTNLSPTARPQLKR